MMRCNTSQLATFARSSVTLVALACATGAVMACARDAGDGDAADAATTAVADGMVYGEPVPVGGGTARSYVTLAAGEPVEIGLALSELALSGLPDQHSPGGMEMPDGMKTFNFDVPMPATNPTAYQHIVFDWNPGGHEPANVYTLPHFDVHFYTISSAERMAILPQDPEFAAKAARFPAAEHLPAGYVAPAPDAVPMMGVHWIDPASPEFNGQTFDRTFIYGSWNGNLIFAEPMITKAFLESRPDFQSPIALAQAYAVPGYYASAYRVRWDEPGKEYRVALSGLQRR